VTEARGSIYHQKTIEFLFYGGYWRKGLAFGFWKELMFGAGNVWSGARKGWGKILYQY